MSGAISRARRRRPGDRALSRRDILIEFHRLGAFVRVVAIDQESGTEVVIVGPAGASPERLSRCAADKLHYVMRRRAKKTPIKRPGIEV